MTQNKYPPGVDGDPYMEYIFDLGFTFASMSMSEIFDDLKKNFPGDATAVVDHLTALFAVANVKVDGGSKEDMVSVANLYGAPQLAKIVENNE